MIRLDARAPVLVGAFLAALLLPWEPLRAQVVRGMVVEQVSLAPVRGALVTLFQERGPEAEPEPVAVTVTDEEGRFLLAAPGPGTFSVQASQDGLTSPVSDTVALDTGQELDGLALLIPSRLLLMAHGCQAAGGVEWTAVVVGVVRDADADVVVPGAWVTAQWREEGGTRSIQANADNAGRYVLCGIPPGGGTVRLQGQILGRASTWEEVEVARPAVVFHDVALPLASPPRGAPTVEQERILLEAAARTLGDLRGQLLDRITGTPIPVAVVRLEGTPHQALTDEDGRFLFVGLQPGAYTLDIRHLGYQARSGAVEIPPGQDVFLRLRVAPQAVELDGIQVSTRSAVDEITRLTPFRRDIVYGQTMALEEERGAQAFEILRRSVPGLRVTELYREAGPPEICVQTNRRVQRLLGGRACENVQVIVDGARVTEGVELFVLRMPAAEIESIEFLPPSQAQILYGTGGNMANGVVIIYTRGKGPYVSPLRGRVP